MSTMCFTWPHHPFFGPDSYNQTGKYSTFSTLILNMQTIFTESALRPIQSISRDVRMCVCGFVSLFVRHTLETTLPEGLQTSGRRAYR